VHKLARDAEDEGTAKHVLAERADDDVRAFVGGFHLGGQLLCPAVEAVHEVAAVEPGQPNRIVVDEGCDASDVRTEYFQHLH
jgi:hypothetical protein